MPRVSKGLTEKAIANAKPRKKNYKLYDRDGLCLSVRTTGKKVWEYHYRHQDKRGTLTIGCYHSNPNKAGHVGLKDARMERYEAVALLNAGVDPNEHKQNLIVGERGSLENSFEAIGREWHRRGTWVAKHAKNILRSLEDDVFPVIGNKQVNKVSPRDIILIIDKIESREAYDVAKRVCQRCASIFDYAMNRDICDTNPALGRAKYVKMVDAKPL